MRILIVWIALFAGAFYIAINCVDPGPPKPWRHERDTQAIVDGPNAHCVLDDTTIVLPGGQFCTGEGWDAE